VERSVENAKKMVQDMLKGMTQTKLSETTGINQVTLANLKNGKAKRITDKVWNRLEKAYDGSEPTPAKPKKKAKPATKVQKKTISPQPEPPKIIKTINGLIAELEDLKKQVEPLVELQQVIKKMK